MGSYNFLKSIAKDNETWILDFRNSIKRGFFALGFSGKNVLCPRAKKLDHLALQPGQP
jgi:hypothetical protein